MKLSLFVGLLLCCLATRSYATGDVKEYGTYVTNDDDLKKAEATFTLARVAKGVVALLAGNLSEDKKSIDRVEFRVTGTLLSNEGYFVAPYNFFVPLCLKDRTKESRFSEPLACADEKKGYYARVGTSLRPVYLVSHLTAEESLPQDPSKAKDIFEAVAGQFGNTNLVIGKIGSFNEKGVSIALDEETKKKIDPLPLAGIPYIEKAPPFLLHEPRQTFVTGVARTGRPATVFSYAMFSHSGARGFFIRPLTERERDCFGKPYDRNLELSEEVFLRRKALYEPLLKKSETEVGLSLREGMRGGPAMGRDASVVAFATSLFPDGQKNTDDAKVLMHATVVFTSANVMYRHFFTDTKPNDPLLEIKLGQKTFYLRKAR